MRIGDVSRARRFANPARLRWYAFHRSVRFALRMLRPKELTAPPGDLQLGPPIADEVLLGILPESLQSVGDGCDQRSVTPPEHEGDAAVERFEGPHLGKGDMHPIKAAGAGRQPACPALVRKRVGRELLLAYHGVTT
jgi:hypothetical protein